jgi:K+-sensing histidine kinase KdpD
MREVILRPGVRVLGQDRVRGTGQGLAIVATIIDRYGGRLELTEAHGGGALVRMLLRENEGTSVPLDNVGESGLRTTTAEMNNESSSRAP